MTVFLQQIANGLVLGGAYVLVATGLFVVYSTLHLPNFAHGETFALGAYLQYTFVRGLDLNFWLAVPLTLVAVGTVGALLERVVFRRLYPKPLLSVFVASLALSVILQELIALVWGREGLAVAAPLAGVHELGGVRIADYRIFVLVAVAAISVALAVLVYRSNFGRSLRALAQNREIAVLAGLNVNFISSATVALSAALAGLAGALLAPTVTLDPQMGFHPTLVAFVILVIAGGSGRLATVAFGGLAVAVLETLAAGYIDNTMRTTVVFVALVVFLMVRPEGAFKSAVLTGGRL
jgi:branched-chain amino acid transport system permease protein